LRRIGTLGKGRHGSGQDWQGDDSDFHQFQDVAPLLVNVFTFVEAKGPRK